MPQISVIIPVYQVEKTLRQCVDSVLNQTYRDFEIILVDDGSPDSSGDICDEYDIYDNVVVIHKENGGISEARNIGLSKARGDFVMFLDSDDYLSEDCLETLLEYDADMVIGSIAVVRDDGRIAHQKERPDEIVPAEQFVKVIPGLFRENRLNYVHAKLYRRSIIMAHNLTFDDYLLTSAEDTVFNFMFLTFCERIYICSKQVHFYRYSNNGLGKKFSPDRYQRSLRLINEITDAVKRMGIDSDEMNKEIRRHRALAAIFTMDGILSQKHMSRKERAKLLDEIASDRELKSLLEQEDFYRSDELKRLIQKGGNRYILRGYIANYKRKLLKKNR